MFSKEILLHNGETALMGAIRPLKQDMRLSIKKS